MSGVHSFASNPIFGYCFRKVAFAGPRVSILNTDTHIDHHSPSVPLPCFPFVRLKVYVTHHIVERVTKMLDTRVNHIRSFWGGGGTCDIHLGYLVGGEEVNGRRLKNWFVWEHLVD